MTEEEPTPLSIVPSTFVMEDIYDMLGDRESGFLGFMDIVLVIAALIGVWKILCFIWGWLYYFNRHYFRPMCQSKTRAFDTYGISE